MNDTNSISRPIRPIDGFTEQILVSVFTRLCLYAAAEKTWLRSNSTGRGLEAPRHPPLFTAPWIWN